MNRNIAIVVGLILFGSLIVGAYAMIPRESTGMTIVFYDENDKAVYEVSSVPQPFGFGFGNQAGASISKAKVIVVYTVLGAPATVAIHADETVTTRLNTQTGGIVKTTTGAWDRTDAKYTQEGTWLLSNIISPVDSSGKTYGWSVEFKVVLTATATIDGQTVTSSTTLSISVLVQWLDAAAAFSINGTISVLAS